MLSKRSFRLTRWRHAAERESGRGLLFAALALCALAGDARAQAPPPPPFVSAANALAARGPLPGYGSDAPAPPRSGLPPSAARHFAETVDSDPLLAPPQPPAKLAYFQPSLSESGGADALRSL